MTVIRILILVALQTAALVYMIFDRQAVLNSAQVVTLKVVPIDPNDIFRGEYVILNYDISRLDLSKLDGDDTMNSGDTVFVTLVREAETWKAVAINRDRPFRIQGGVALRGSVQWVDGASGGTAPQSIQVTFGIESYFVPQGTGRAIEDEARKGDLSVDIAVDAQGRGAIKAIRRKEGVIYVEGIL
ncbi:MAG: GDYXXLXY domain-containing protein [Alphaproteobacteria bacterium]|nr:GDYXXLXY domain-containing protein [Alphaproteobacteria bacterium]